ncbi:MAG TPA: hypothetical protein VHO50_04485 [Bacteroidales bacterium]|nr:hypothetical protein [Bacteroidales bacterium]
MIKHSFFRRNALIYIFALVSPISLFSQSQVLNVPEGLSGIGSTVSGNNIGIGTDSPNTKLHIYNNVMDAPALILHGSTIDPDVSSYHYVGLRFDGDFGNATGNYSEIRSHSNLYAYWGSYLTFHTTTADEAHSLVERMRILPNGNVGIGISNPDSKLTIFNDGASSSPYLLNVGGSGNGWMKVRHIDGKDWQSGDVGDLYFQYGKNKNTIINGGEGSGAVGIGTENPSQKLDVNGAIKIQSGVPFILGSVQGTQRIQTGNGNFQFISSSDAYADIYAANGLFEGISASRKIGFNINDAFDVSGNSVAHYGTSLISGIGYNNVALSGYYGLEFYTEGQQRIKIAGNGNVGIGTSNPSARLDVNGIIRANEIVVNTSGADFVFDPEYNLPELDEVEKYIEENKHLPDVPPASEMQTDGMSVSEMQTKLLQKIEELILYSIEQNKMIQEQKELNEKQEKEIAELKKMLNN